MKNKELTGQQDNSSVLKLVKQVLGIITAFSVVLEIVLFPSFANLFGAIMMVVSYMLFSLFLKEFYIVERPFSFFMLFSGFCFHWLPVPAMLINWKPVSFGMEVPIQTFLMETLLFAVMCFAFYLASLTTRKKRLLTTIWGSLGLYSVPKRSMIWFVGIMGCLGKIYFLATGGISEDIISRILNIWIFYMVFPVVLLFPCLYKSNPKYGIKLGQISVWIYIVLISILTLSTNSRRQLIIPFATIALLYILAIVYCNIPSRVVFKPGKILAIVALAFSALSLFTNISHAMLLNRAIRRDVSFSQLLRLTIDTMLDDSFSESWIRYSRQNVNNDYRAGWTENYLDSEWLNRFCNIRITDATLFYGSNFSETRKKEFRTDFGRRLISVYPQPVLDIFGSKIDKTQYNTNSRGDMLYYYSGYGSIYNLGGFRVTSHLGDGYVTFGWLYYLIQFLSWFVVMRLLNTFVGYFSDKPHYSVLALVFIFDGSMLRFQNSNGMIIDFSYMLRGYWQDCILFFLTMFVAGIVCAWGRKK